MIITNILLFGIACLIGIFGDAVERRLIRICEELKRINKQ